MAKKFSKINFIIVSIVVAIGIFLSVCSFSMPFGITDNFAGFANAISLNYDLGEGQTAVFEAKPVDTSISTLTEGKVKETANFVQKVLSMFGETYNQVGVENSNMVRAEIKSSTTSASLMEAMANRVELVIREKESQEKTELQISAQRIKKCSVSYQPTENNSYSYGVLIEFDSLGTKQYKALTEYVAKNGSTVYFYDTEGNNIGKLSQVTKTSPYGQTFLAKSDVNSETEIKNYAINVMMGALDVKLNLKENSVSASYLGNNAIIYIVISLFIAFVIVNVLLIVRYRDLGLISLLTNTLNVVLYLFLLQAFPNTFFRLSLAGVFGAIVGYALTIVCHVVIYERIRKEYKNGKKIPLSFKLGFKESTLTIVDLTSIAAIISVALYFIGHSILKSFAVTLFVGSVLAIFSSLIVTKSFTKWYLNLNSTKANKLALVKGEVKDEE